MDSSQEGEISSPFRENFFPGKIPPGVRKKKNPLKTMGSIFLGKRRNFCSIDGMRAFPVYCMNPEDGTVMRLGSILEMRKSRRSMNRVSLAKLAQRIFSRRPGDIIYIGSHSVLDQVESIPDLGLADSAG